MQRYLVLDTETGGLDPEQHSLLTVAFSLLKDDFSVIAELDLPIKHDPYRVQPKALTVNNINLIEHDKNAFSVDDAHFQIEALSWNHALPDKTNPVTPVGWNVEFDLKMVQQQLYPIKNVVSYRVLDLQTINHFLTFHSLSIKGGLHMVAEYHGIPVVNAHTARGDVDICVQLLRKFAQLSLNKGCSK